MSDVLNILCAAIALNYVGWYTYKYPARASLQRFVDFHCYYHAARGDFSWWPSTLQPGARYEGWVYAKWSRWIWWPFTLLPIGIAEALFFVFNMLAYGALLAALAAVPYGWLIMLASIKIAAIIIWSGNVQLIMAALCLVPGGWAITTLVKPHLALIGFVQTFWQDFVAWFGAAH
jgi:hypothetical protein